MKVTVGTTYEVEMKYQGKLGSAHVTHVYADGEMVGEVDVFPGTAVWLPRVEAALAYPDNRDAIFKDWAGNRSVVQLKADAVQALIERWHAGRAK